MSSMYTSVCRHILDTSICHFADYSAIGIYCAVDYNNIIIITDCSTFVARCKITMQYGALLMMIMYHRYMVSAHDANTELCTGQNFRR